MSFAAGVRGALALRRRDVLHLPVCVCVYVCLCVCVCVCERERETERARERERERKIETEREIESERERERERAFALRRRDVLHLPVRIHFIIVMIRWIGLAPWEFEFPSPGSLTSTFLGERSRFAAETFCTFRSTNPLYYSLA